MAAIFTLTNCAKETDAPTNENSNVEGLPFEVVASTNNQTKTSNEGVNTVWTAGDAINVWHAEAGSTEYNPAFTSFTVAEGDTEAGRFTGELNPETPLSEANDWYFFYPYNQYNKTPAGSAYENFSYQKIAQAHDGVQVQSGNDDMAHLVGTAFPLYGKVTSVASGDEVSTSMNQVVSVVKVTVTNNTSEPLTVNKVTFTSPQDIVGTFYVNFVGETLDFNSTGSGFVAKTATLNVENAEAIPAEGSASFYLGVKPFTQSSGNLVVAVNSLEKTIPISSEVTFSSGKIKTINFNYNEVVDEPVIWDLTKDETSSKSEDVISWDSDYVLMSNTRKSGGTSAMNWYGGDSQGHTTTKFYTNSTLLIAPKDGYALEKVIIRTNSAESVKNISKWTNAATIIDGNDISIYSLNGEAISCLVTGQSSLFGVDVYYVSSDDFKEPVVESIAVSDQTTSFKKDDEFYFDGVVIATYNNGATLDVSTSAEFSGYDLTSIGNQTITVSYNGKTTTYIIEIIEDDGSKTVVYTITSTTAVDVTGDIPSGSTETYSSTYSSKYQLTSGNSMNLSISGMDGMTVKGITLSMKSNASKGSGYYSAKIGDTLISSIGTSGSGIAFNNALWNGKYSSEYVDITPAVAETIVGEGETLTIVIGATVNSLYCQTISITYTVPEIAE